MTVFAFWFDVATKSNTIRFSVRELYAGCDFLNDFTTRVNSYIGTTIVVPDMYVRDARVDMDAV